jgi:DNA/RNA endonuclease YhcR with UshA esterase domain
MTIFAYISDKNIDAGWVPLHALGPNILFGNFIATNHDGKIYECINISDESVTITAPIVQLTQCETTIKQNTVDRGEIKKEASIKGETISIRRMFQENITDYENKGNGDGDGPIDIIQMNKLLENNQELLTLLTLLTRSKKYNEFGRPRRK